MLINKENWAEKTNNEKAKIVCEIISLPTDNGVTKSDYLLMLDWAFHQIYKCDNVCASRKNRLKDLVACRNEVMRDGENSD